MGGGGILRPVTDLVFGRREGAQTGGLDSTADLGKQYADQINKQLTGLQPQQTDFGKALADQALGKTPSIAETVLKANNERTLAQQLAAVKANKAVNPALAQRQVLQQAGQANQATAQQAAVARMQEQNQNQQAFGNYLNSLYGAQNGAIGATTGANTAAANARLANDAADDKRTGSLLNLAASSSAAPLLSDKRQKKNIKPVKMAKGGPVTANEIYGSPIASDQIIMPDEALTDVAGKEVGGGFKDLFKKKPEQGDLMAGSQMDDMGSAFGSGALPAMDSSAVMLANHGAVVPGSAKVKGDSEKNDTVHALLSPGEIVVPRTVVAKGPDAVKTFAQALMERQPQKMSEGGKVEKPLDLDKLKAYEYEYKDTSLPGTSPGKQVSVMAQDLEKAGPLGRSMVQETPIGKMVDYNGKGFAALLAAQAQLNERLKNIDARLGKKK